MTYIIHNNQRALSYFHSNGNGEVKDILGFSNNNYFIHETEKEALNHVEFMKRSIKNNSNIREELKVKINGILNKLKIARKSN